MKLAGAAFKKNEMRHSLWNEALYCETFCEKHCGCQSFMWFKRKIDFFVTEKYLAV